MTFLAFKFGRDEKLGSPFDLVLNYKIPQRPRFYHNPLSRDQIFIIKLYPNGKIRERSQSTGVLKLLLGPDKSSACSPTYVSPFIATDAVNS